MQHFFHQWNNHPLQTEYNRTPIQLYIQGLLTSHSSGRTETKDIFNVRGNHEVDEGYIAENDDSMVTVPPTLSPLTESLTSQLRQMIDPLLKAL